jgi:hypothetical protein
MKTLDEHNTEVMNKLINPNRGNGIACPQCGGELYDSSDVVLLSHPPQYHVACFECAFKGNRY